MYNIEDIKSVIFDGSCFYILANKMNKKIGYFLVGFDQ